MTYLERKRTAIMRLIEGVKGFVRTVSGIPPLTLPACVDTESIIDYTISGNSVQNGTPTPDNPIEVESVGVLTENLFDNAMNWSGIGNSSIPSYGDDFVQKLDGGGYHIGGHSSVSFTFNNLVAGETYTLSYLLTADDAGTLANLIYVGSSTSYEYLYSKGARGRVTKKFTVGDSGSITFKFGLSNMDKGYGHYYGGTITELMLVKGSTAKAYEPYGYKVPIVCSGKNLFNSLAAMDNGYYAADKSTATFADRVTTISNIQGKNNPNFCFKIPVVKGEKYTISAGVIENSYNSTLARIAVCSSVHPDEAKFGYLYSNGKLTVTATSNYLYLKNYIAWGTNNATLTIEKLQVERGSSKTAYEEYKEPTTTNIYLDAPLKGVGEYTDTINFKDQKTTQRIGVKVFDGSEDWSVSSTTNNRYMSPQITDVMVDDKINNNSYYLSNNYFTPISWSERDNYTENDDCCYVYVSNANKQIVVGSPNTKTLADFKAWLSDMYASGTPFTICYPLQETNVTEEIVDLSVLPTLQGSTVYTVDLAVQPSDMSARYYSSQKGASQ